MVHEVITYALAPAAAIWLHRREGMGWLDPIWGCYAVGMIMANTPIPVQEEVARGAATAAVPLALPMLLFRTDLRAWAAQSRQAILAFVVAVLTVLASALGWGAIFGDRVPGLSYVGGMMTATLTGGSPNLVSVGEALETPAELFVLTQAADVITGGIYLLFLLTVARAVLGRWLRQPEDPRPMKIDEEASARSLRARFGEGAVAVAASLGIAAVSAGLAWAITGKLHEPLVLMGLTSGGLLASMSPRMRQMTTGFEIGNYLILCFCVAIGSLTDLGAMWERGGMVLAYAAVLLSTALVLHYLLCRLFGVDVDTAIMASTASIMGPALVVPVARRLDNQQAFVSGLTNGLVGLALGNYLGLGVAALLS